MRKNHRKHFHRNADGPHDDAAVKIHVRIQFALHKIGILQRRFFQPLGDVQQRVGEMQNLEQIVAGLFDDLGARVVILINPMAEAHEFFAAVLVLGRRDEF